jgi:hypothetical protein
MIPLSYWLLLGILADPLIIPAPSSISILGRSPLEECQTAAEMDRELSTTAEVLVCLHVDDRHVLQTKEGKLETSLQLSSQRAGCVAGLDQ